MEEKKYPPPSFSSFITSLASSALIGLGILPNPKTGKTEEDLDMAKYTIETLDILREKTRGNLTEEEEKIMTEIITELKIKYVEAVKRRSKS